SRVHCTGNRASSPRVCLDIRANSWSEVRGCETNPLTRCGRFSSPTSPKPLGEVGRVRELTEHYDMSPRRIPLRTDKCPAFSDVVLQCRCGTRRSQIAWLRQSHWFAAFVIPTPRILSRTSRLIVHPWAMCSVPPS